MQGRLDLHLNTQEGHRGDSKGAAGTSTRLASVGVRARVPAHAFVYLWGRWGRVRVYICVPRQQFQNYKVQLLCSDSSYDTP